MFKMKKNLKTICAKIHVEIILTEWVLNKSVDSLYYEQDITISAVQIQELSGVTPNLLDYYHLISGQPDFGSMLNPSNYNNKLLLSATFPTMLTASPWNRER